MLLWQEYKAQYPDGYQYSQFCHLYRQWAGRIDPVMRQEHRAGEKMFVDYAGQTIGVYDPTSKKTREAQSIQSLYWALQTTLMPKQHGHRNYRIGSVPTAVPMIISAVFLK